MNVLETANGRGEAEVLFSCGWTYCDDRADFNEMEIEDSTGDYVSAGEALAAAIASQGVRR